MTTLLEVQQAVLRSLIGSDDQDAARHVVADGIAPAARLNIYRNTFIGVLTTALRLSFPAVHRLVGAEFFESVARIFIEAAPPRSAWLDEYGAAFPAFLAGFAPAASLPYLPDVARLEWAVSRALHAADAAPLDVAALAAIGPDEHGRIAFIAHPSIGLLHAQQPADTIWRAVLAEDDAAMAGLDLEAGPVWLLIQRGTEGITVTRCEEVAWRFAAAVFAAQPLGAAIDAAPEAEAAILLADHLAAGRFVGFTLTDTPEEHQ